MIVKCAWEHNGNDTLLFAVDYIGAFTRGETENIAVAKMPNEIKSYVFWRDGVLLDEEISVVVVQEKVSDLQICDADSDIILESETLPLYREEYLKLKNLVLKSARDFLALYQSITDKDFSALLPQKTFYGEKPLTAREMYEHTKNVNEYYFSEINIPADNDGTIVECRERGFERLEKTPNFLNSTTILGSYGETWSLRKVLRRFVWHDRIHAKAMRKMALKTFGTAENPFCFE